VDDISDSQYRKKYVDTVRTVGFQKGSSMAGFWDVSGSTIRQLIGWEPQFSCGVAEGTALHLTPFMNHRIPGSGGALGA
jgi:hypothetical protein